MINQTQINLLEQYDYKKIPSLNSVAYRLLIVLLEGEKYSNPSLSLMIGGTANNAVTRLRVKYHWLVYFHDGYWWLDERHLPINGIVCSKENAKASAEAYVTYATESKKQAEREAERVPKANLVMQKAVIRNQEVNAE